MKEIYAKTQARFEQIAAGVQGRLGLVVEDLAGEYRFAVDPDGVFPQASAIKIPILMELLQQGRTGRLDLSTRVAITAANQAAGTGCLAELSDGGTQMSLEDLAVLMITISDNTATNILIDAIGMAAANDMLASLGLEQTRLRRVMMDMAAAARGEENTSTPAEAARIMRLLAEGAFIDRSLCNHVLAILRKPKRGAVNATLPRDVSVAFKPGAIPGAATEWALVELPGRPYLVTAMGSYGVGKEMDVALKHVGSAAYDFFHRVVEATPHGAYAAPYTK